MRKSSSFNLVFHEPGVGTLYASSLVFKHFKTIQWAIIVRWAQAQYFIITPSEAVMFKPELNSFSNITHTSVTAKSSNQHHYYGRICIATLCTISAPVV